MLGASISNSMSKRNTVSLIGGNRISYEDKLRNNLDFTNVNKPINVTNRFKPVIKANNELQNELKKDIRVLKEMDKESNGISVLSDKIMARSDIYKTISAIRNAQRSVIAEQTKIITGSVKMENEIIKNLGGNGDNSNTGNTSSVLSAIHSGGLNIAPIIGGGGYNQQVAPSPVNKQEPIMSGIEDEERVSQLSVDEVSPVNIEDTSEVEDVFAPTVQSSNDTMNQGSNVIDYSVCLSNNKMLRDNPTVVIAYDESQKLYCQAYQKPSGELVLEDNSLVPIKVLGNVEMDFSTMSARDSIGGEYNIVYTSINNPRIIREFMEK